MQNNFEFAIFKDWIEELESYKKIASRLIESSMKGEPHDRKRGPEDKCRGEVNEKRIEKNDDCHQEPRPRWTNCLWQLPASWEEDLSREGKTVTKAACTFSKLKEKTMTYQSSTSVTVGIQAGNEENSRLSEEWVRLKRLVTTVASSHESPGGGYSRIDVILSCVTEEVRDLKCFIPSHPSYLHRDC